MDATAPSATSRVIVELTDPSNLWDSFEPLLSEHLPLQNLHWKSPKRPLRSIDTLLVAITRAEENTVDSKQVQRRHQIPGLEQTPYLKVYLLRCDDKETYKETCRKQIRQWIKNNAPTSGLKSTYNENHDAFEWLIVHIVLPDTPAAAEARFSKHASLGTTDSTESVGSNVGGKGKWPGKSSSTIFEKLRADFGSSSKSALDRVTQIRLPKADGQTRPPASFPPSELEIQWDDVVGKFKAAILSSFHTRVAQYEDDIRERDSQRHLPGWNFCTFFILKEGLAQGFESVGLLEDASMIYDELALGLDILVREQGDEDGDQEGALLPFSKELKDKIRSALDNLQAGSNNSSDSNTDIGIESMLDADTTELPLSSSRKKYRELILANDVSSLDFRIYVFTRQLELLHRRLRTLQRSKASYEVFPTLNEISKRSVAFINLAARGMRQDLYNAWGGKTGLDKEDLRIQRLVINNIVSTWTWRAVLQILSETSTDALAVPDSLLNPALGPKSEHAHLSNGGVTDEDQESVPKRMRPISVVLEDLPPEDSIPQNTFDGSVSDKVSDSATIRPGQKSTSRELASSRAELLLLARSIIESIARDSQVHSPGVTDAVSNDERTDTSENYGLSDEEGKEKFNDTAGLECAFLRRAAKSSTVFFAAYERLTDLACRYFLAAEKFNNAERAMVNLADLSYDLGDFSTALRYFEQLQASSNTGSWPLLARQILSKHAECLKRLDRTDDLVYCLLDLLSLTSSSNESADDKCWTKCRFDDLLLASESLTQPLKIPFHTFFELSSDTGPQFHPSARHGICLSLTVRSKISADLSLTSGSSLILCALENAQPTKIRLNVKEAVSAVGPSFSTLQFVSHESTLGWYRLEYIEFVLGNLVFVHDFSNHAGSDFYHFENHPEPKKVNSSVLLYPSSTSPVLKAIPATNTDLSHPRQIFVGMTSPSTRMWEIVLTSRPATAGLRLRLGDSEVAGADQDLTFNISPGKSIEIETLLPDHCFAINLPYTLENAEITELDIRVEVQYTTEHGSFIYHTLLSISTILQVSVNVHDIFKEDALFSRFTITPSTLVPLRLKGCSIKGMSHESAGSGRFPKPLDVFPKQPASWVCKFDHKSKSGQSNDSSPPTLMIEFESIDEMVLSTLETRFLEDLRQGDCSGLSALLSSHLLGTYRSKWTEQDLETACLLHEVEIWTYEDLDWESILAGLDKKQSQKTSAWLRKWHDSNSVIDLGLSQAPLRCIGIPIEIPTPRVLVSVSLELKHGASSPYSIGLGQPIAADLLISRTDMWQRGAVGTSNDNLEVSFEVTASPELWLIGGSRRGTINLHDIEERFRLLLLPQRAGHIMLPSVDVKCFSTVDGKERVEVACETDHGSQAKTFLVTPDLRSTTIKLGEDAAAAAAAGGGV